jgi:predicted DNA-binding protein
MARVLTRHFSLPRALNERLEELSRRPGTSRSAIVVKALTDFLDRSGDDALELRFAERLDRLSRQLYRIERNSRVEIETLALFVRYMLTVNAPLPEGDDAARAVGRDRFQRFVEHVGRRLAGGKLTLLPEDDE